ncbi:hypothetical protein PRIPAC_88100 [Pristionchus pacificus]|uniref:Uncharacterized protein n=1 Tax=Pristionchus pacificus TaxID=54126 RepID=A0A2A6B7E9_PRIPA|nr:hypothetical protein PRIPAC_88100 [Pristionchus pacificus]|eukprot:PDM61798.1 hypothetical protein PRIPAC_51240 [Pristionchus pacificus]
MTRFAYSRLSTSDGDVEMQIRGGSARAKKIGTTETKRERVQRNFAYRSDRESKEYSKEYLQKIRQQIKQLDALNKVAQSEYVKT